MISVITADDIINIANPATSYFIILFVVVVLTFIICVNILLKSVQNKPVKSFLDGTNIIISPLLVLFFFILIYKMASLV